TNTQWSPNSSAIILVAVTAENISKIEIFDAGLAVGALCLQATAMGLHTHQMGGFSKSKVKEVFSLPDNVEPVVLINVGQISDPTNLSQALKERELAPRSRKTLSELTLKGLE
ncbi:MAG: nitroreductase family protein, partial [Actinomycetes bacterium]